MGEAEEVSEASRQPCAAARTKAATEILVFQKRQMVVLNLDCAFCV